MVKKHLILSLLSIFTLNSSCIFAFSLESSTFFNQDNLPTTYTCDGKDISPDLTWKSTPKKTQSYTLIFSDLDAPGGTFYHWVLFNLPASVNSLSEGIKQLPASTVIGKTSWGKMQYNGPCPPKGTSHRYVFSVYALNTTLSLPADSDASAVLNAIQNHVLDEADLKVNYSR